jgi:hypothetical protein
MSLQQIETKDLHRYDYLQLIETNLFKPILFKLLANFSKKFLTCLLEEAETCMFKTFFQGFDPNKKAIFMTCFLS